MRLILSGREKPTIDLNRLYNYVVHILRPQNIECGKPELNSIGEKTQDKMSLLFIKP